MNDKPKPKCIECRLEIEPGATICVHCNSRQTWRRYLNFSSTILSLMVALISVLALALPQVQKVFHTPSSKVEVELLHVDGIKPRGGSSMNGFWTEYVFGLHIQVTLTNSGDRPGVLSGGLVDLRVGSESVAAGRFVIESPDNPVPPNTVRVVHLRALLRPTKSALFPDSLREGSNDQLLDASRESETGSETLRVVPPINLSGGDITISTIQSNGKREKIKLEIEPQMLSFSKS